jgi:uncharacterized protein (DUF952 family)
MFQHIMHITTRAEWEAARTTGSYAPESLAAEGFIHCSTPDQVLDIANSFYRGRAGLVLLRIEPRRLRVEVCYENLEGGRTLFPHVYGPIEVDAVEAVLDFPPNSDGMFKMPEFVAPASPDGLVR